MLNKTFFAIIAVLLLALACGEQSKKKGAMLFIEAEKKSCVQTLGKDANEILSQLMVKNKVDTLGVKKEFDKSCAELGFEVKQRVQEFDHVGNRAIYVQKAAD